MTYKEIHLSFMEAAYKQLAHKQHIAKQLSGLNPFPLSISKN